MELYHFGIPEMKWGVRRFQNKDGSLTPEGKQRYYDLKNAQSKWLQTYNLKDRKALTKAQNRYAQAQLLINPKKYRESLGISKEQYAEARRKVISAIDNVRKTKAMKVKEWHSDEEYEALLQTEAEKIPGYKEARDFLNQYADVPFSELVMG